MKSINEKTWVKDGHVRTSHRPSDEVKLHAAGYVPFEDNAAKGASEADPTKEALSRLAEIHAQIVDLSEEDDAEEIASLQREVASIAEANPDIDVDLVNGEVKVAKPTPKSRK